MLLAKSGSIIRQKFIIVDVDLLFNYILAHKLPDTV